MSVAGTDTVASAARLEVLLVSLGDARLALPLLAVVEVLPGLALSPLPKAPAVVAGVANLRGEPLPVVDLRARLGRPTRAMHPDDHVVVCLVGSRRVGIWVDQASDLDRVDADSLVSVDRVAEAGHVQGLAALPDGLLVVCDVRSFLDADEALALDSALADLGSRGR